MSNIICIAYQPGAFGSFLGWTIDRFNAARKQYQPAVIDDPLTSDGSSRGYASFCKVMKNSDFVEGLYESRRTETVHGYQIHAGWPQGVGENLLWSINRVANNMSTFDKMFVIECKNPIDHYVRYIRNETMMDRDRWYGMLEAKNGDDIYKRLSEDIANGGLPDDYQHNKICRIGFSDILYGTPRDLFDKIFDHLETRPCDFDMFVETISRMRTMQDAYLDRVDLVRSGEVNTPAEEAVYRCMESNQ